MLKKFKSSLSVLVAMSVIFSLTACGGTKTAAEDTAAQSTAAASSSASTATNSAPKEVKTLRLSMQASFYGKGWQTVEADVNSKADQLGFKLDVDKVGDGDQGKQVLQARFASGDYPDLLAFNSVAAIDGSFHNVDKLIDITGLDFSKNFDDKILSSIYSYNGKTVAVPMGGSNLPAVFYNKKVFEKLGVTAAPKNWTEFTAILDKAKAAGITPYFTAGKDTWTVQVLTIAGFQRDLKGKDVNQEIANLYTNKTSIESYKLFADTLTKARDLVVKGYVQKTWLSDTYDAQQKAVADGTCAMTANATWMMDEIQKKYPDKVNDIGAFSPVFDGEDPIGMWMPNMVAGYNTSKNIEEVKSFLNYFGSVDTQTKYFNAAPAISMVKGIKVEGLSPASQQVLDEYQNSGRGMLLWQSAAPQGITQIKLGSSFSDITMKAMLGNTTPEQLLKEMRSFEEKDAKSKNAPGW